MNTNTPLFPPNLRPIKPEEPTRKADDRVSNDFAICAPELIAALRTLSRGIGYKAMAAQRIVDTYTCTALS